MKYRPSWETRARLLTARALGDGFSALFSHAHRVGLLPDHRHVRVIHDVPYGRHPRQQVDLYLPAQRTREPLPTVFFVHGGGWIACNRRMSAALARTLAARGIAVVAPGYRLLPEVTGESQRADVQAALRWFMDGGAKRFGLDRERFVIGGESAGAHLTLRTVQAWPSEWPKPRGVFGVYGLYDVAHLEEDRTTLFHPVRAALTQGRPFRDAASDHSALRPLPWVDVPVLLLHGEDDPIAPVTQSELLAKTLAEHGVDVRVRTYPGGHGFIYHGHPQRRHIAARAYRSLFRFLAETGMRGDIPMRRKVSAPPAAAAG